MTAGLLQKRPRKNFFAKRGMRAGRPRPQKSQLSIVGRLVMWIRPVCFTLISLLAAAWPLRAQDRNAAARGENGPNSGLRFEAHCPCPEPDLREVLAAWRLADCQRRSDSRPAGRSKSRPLMTRHDDMKRALIGTLFISFSSSIRRW